MPRPVAPVSLRFEHRTDDGPLVGIGTPAPRLSWQVPTAEAGYRQSAYEVEIVRGDAVPESYVVESGEQVLVPWPGTPLKAREAAAVRVRVRGDGDWSDWSEPAKVEAGLLTAADWTARFVSPRDIGSHDSPAPIVGGVIDLPDDVVSARLYATAHGVYVPELNGRRVGDEELAPGWTAYQHRLRYQTYDVTDLVVPGENRLEFLLGNGWYRGRLGFRGEHGLYGDQLAVLAQLEATTADGSVHVLNSDSSWTARESGSSPTTCTTASRWTSAGPWENAVRSRCSTPTWVCLSRPTAHPYASPAYCRL